MSFSTIPIKTTIPTPGTTPAAASAFIVFSIDEVNTLEITGDCSAGSGSLILVRYFADLDEWRPWHEDRPLTVDSAVRDGLFSGVYPIPKGDEAFVLYDSAAAITATVKARRTSSPDEATAPLPSGAATSALQGAGLPTALVGGKLDVNLGTSSITLPISAAANLPVAQAGVANFQYITAAGTYALKTSAGILRYIAVTAKFSAGSLSVFNANNAETSPIAGFDLNVNFFWPLNQTCSNGITVVAGAGFNGQVAVGWD